MHMFMYCIHHVGSHCGLDSGACLCVNYKGGKYTCCPINGVYTVHVYLVCGMQYLMQIGGSGFLSDIHVYFIC